MEQNQNTQNTKEQPKETIERLYTNLEKSKSDKLDYALKILSNGMKILFISDPKANMSAASLEVNVGYFSDEPDAQGLAHFCEHLLFMGTKKYPQVNEYQEFLTKNGGSSNASTSNMTTKFHFNVSNTAFDEALDRFAHFFICPIFDPNSIEKEIKAIDSENSKNLTDDNWRFKQLVFSEANEGSPFRNFSTGNKETLNIPNLRDRLLEMYQKYYSSEIMSLCVYNNKPMNELIKYVEDLFVQVPKRENFVMPKYDVIKPYTKENLGYFYKVLPLKNLDTIKFSWYFPYIFNYKAKPIYYILDLLGHEGPNTLTASLYRDNYITTLVSSDGYAHGVYSTLNIDIALTKKGLENVKEIIIRVLNYIRVIQKKPINEKFFKELKDVMQMRFDFQSKATGIGYTTTYSSNLKLVEPEDILTGVPLIKEYNEPLIREILDSLTLDNLNIFFISKSIEKDCNLEEKWYGTKYSKEKINITQEEIDSYKCRHVFDYPPENKFIPKNFDILPVEGEVKNFPEKIMNDENCKVWFLKDDIFKLPKAIIGVNFELPENLCNNSDFKNSVLGALLTKIINKDLDEVTYMAKEANLEFSIGISKNKITMIIQGYNDSMKEGLKEIVKEIKNLKLTEETHKEFLDLIINEMKKKLANIYLSKSYSVNILYLKTLMGEQNRDPEEMIRFLNETKITVDDVVIFKNNLFKSVKTNWLIQGNISKDTSLEIVNEVNKIFEIDTKKKINFNYSDRCVQITKNYNYIFRHKSKNTSDKDSSISSLYDCGILNDLERQYFYIIITYLKEIFFNQLRTTEGLGYVVSLLSLESEKIFSLIAIIQSNTKTPEYCAERIRNFFLEKEKNIKEMSDEDFKKIIDSRIVKANRKENNLSELFTLNWTEIMDDNYKFNKKEIDKENLAKCKKEEMIQFYVDHFIKDVTKLDCEYVCEAHFEENEKIMKEVNDNEKFNIKKRIFVDKIADFKACNGMYPNLSNSFTRELYKKLNNN